MMSQSTRMLLLSRNLKNLTNKFFDSSIHLSSNGRNVNETTVLQETLKQPLVWPVAHAKITK